MKLYTLFSFFAIVLLSCKEVPVPAPNNQQPPTPEPQLPKYRSVEVGNGHGNLVIDGSLLSLNCNDTIKITGGLYNSITVKNISNDAGCNVMVVNKGLVELEGDFKQLNLSNLSGVTFSGNGDPKINFGFQFRNNVYRAIVISKPYNRNTIQFCSFQNIFDYVISYNNETEFDGTPESYSQDLKFLNNQCENTATFINMRGVISPNKVTGHVKNVEIAYLLCKNTDGGDMVNIGSVENYDVHHNRIENLNPSNNNHNGIFHLSGSGKFYNNYIVNHQGNAIRAWVVSMGAQPKDVLIFNNIVVGSRKYSAFEVQSFENYMGPKTTHANVEIYNNTCGNINMSKDWYGGVVDVYNLYGGACKIFNNIGFNFPSSNPNSKIVNQQSSTNPQISNNLYFDKISEVGFSDESRFILSPTSAAKNKGLSVQFLTTDYYGEKRNAAQPSIGAVE